MQQCKELVKLHIGKSFHSLGVIFMAKLAIKKLQNFWVPKVFMSSYILCKIWVFKPTSQKKLLKQLIRLCPFNLQNLCFSRSIRNCTLCLWGKYRKRRSTYWCTREIHQYGGTKLGSVNLRKTNITYVKFTLPEYWRAGRSKSFNWNTSLMFSRIPLVMCTWKTTILCIIHLELNGKTSEHSRFYLLATAVS